jgi:hypothetical protein
MAKVKFSGAFEGTPSRERGGAIFTPAPRCALYGEALTKYTGVVGHENDCTALGQASRQRKPSSSSTRTAAARSAAGRCSRQSPG